MIELKNILILFFTAKLVVDGELTLGMLLSISYILGQLNGPITSMVGFVHTYQDAKIGLERLSDIHNRDNDKELIKRQGVYFSVIRNQLELES